MPIAEPIYEFGALRVSGQETSADLRPFFPGKEYVGTDMREGLGVDMIIDLHDIKLMPESVGTAISVATFEHVEYPRKAIEQIYAVVRPGGMFIITAPMYAKIHGFPHDYWRFTPECFNSLLKPFPNCFVSCAGKERFPHTVVGIGFNGPAPPLEALKRALEGWHLRWSALNGKPKESLLKKWHRKAGKSVQKRWSKITCKR